MRGLSRTSLAEARERLEPLLASGTDSTAGTTGTGSTGGAVGGAGQALGTELFSVVSLLDANSALRRALTDPSLDGEAKAALVTRLLAGQLGDLYSYCLAQTASGDLADVAEVLGGLREAWAEGVLRRPPLAVAA